MLALMLNIKNHENMNTAIKIMLMSIAMIFTFNANAQSKLEQKAQAEADEITAALELDEDTSKKIYDVVLETKKMSRSIHKAFKNEEIDETERKEQMSVIHKEKIEKFKTILSKKQMNAYWKYKKAKKANSED